VLLEDKVAVIYVAGGSIGARTRTAATVNVSGGALID
jgi:hypothetical protein